MKFMRRFLPLTLAGIAIQAHAQTQKLNNAPVCPLCKEPNQDSPAKWAIYSDTAGAAGLSVMPNNLTIVCKKCGIHFDVIAPATVPLP